MNTSSDLVIVKKNDVLQRKTTKKLERSNKGDGWLDLARPDS